MASLQESVVQAKPSSQETALPAWQPAVASQDSTPLQKSPSAQSVSSGAPAQASAASSQKSPVHAMPSSQVTAVPAWHPASTSQDSTPLQ